MKNTKMKAPSKTPIDVLRRLEEARRAANELANALEGIDPAAFPTDVDLVGARQLACASLESIQNMLDTRPLTKTERARLAAAEAVASSESTPPGVVEAQLEAA